MISRNTSFRRSALPDKLSLLILLPLGKKFIYLYSLYKYRLLKTIDYYLPRSHVLILERLPGVVAADVSELLVWDFPNGV